jgi:hypothetical protein
LMVPCPGKSCTNLHTARVEDLAPPHGPVGSSVAIWAYPSKAPAPPRRRAMELPALDGRGGVDHVA